MSVQKCFCKNQFQIVCYIQNHMSPVLRAHFTTFERFRQLSKHKNKPVTLNLFIGIQIWHYHFQALLVKKIANFFPVQFIKTLWRFLENHSLPHELFIKPSQSGFALIMPTSKSVFYEQKSCHFIENLILELKDRKQKWSGDIVISASTV